MSTRQLRLRVGVCFSERKLLADACNSEKETLKVAAEPIAAEKASGPLSFPKIPSGLDSHRETESSHH